MKRLLCFLILFLVFIVSCTSKNETLEILQSAPWTSNQVKANQNGKFQDKLTFFKNDSFKVEMYYKGRSFGQSYSGKYFFKKDENKLTIEVNSVQSNFNIIAISEDSFSLKETRTNTVTSFKKLDQKEFE